MSKRNGAQLELSKKGSMMHYKRLATPYLLLAPHAGVCRLLYDLAHHKCIHDEHRILQGYKAKRSAFYRT